MRTFTLSIAITLLCAISSTVSASKMPDPAISEFVETESGGFVVEPGQGIKYAMTYKLLAPSQPATSYKVVFDNTKPKGAALQTEGTIKSGTLELVVQSPAIAGAKNDRTFTVLLSLYVDGRLLATHKDQVKFSLPSNLMKQMGIKEY